MWLDLYPASHSYGTSCCILQLSPCPISPFPLRTSCCILSHLFHCIQPVFATEHHAASCESHLSVSPFPLYPACINLPCNTLLHPVNLTFPSHFFLCIQHVFAMGHHTASCEYHLSLSHLFHWIQHVCHGTSCCIPWVSPLPLYPAHPCHGTPCRILWILPFPVSPFPLNPPCLCHGTSCCILWVS